MYAMIRSALNGSIWTRSCAVPGHLQWPRVLVLFVPTPRATDWRRSCPHFVVDTLGISSQQGRSDGVGNGRDHKRDRRWKYLQPQCLAKASRSYWCESHKGGSALTLDCVLQYLDSFKRLPEKHSSATTHRYIVPFKSMFTLLLKNDTLSINDTTST